MMTATIEPMAMDRDAETCLAKKIGNKTGAQLLNGTANGLDRSPPSNARVRPLKINIPAKVTIKEVFL